MLLNGEADYVIHLKGKKHRKNEAKEKHAPQGATRTEPEEEPTPEPGIEIPKNTALLIEQSAYWNDAVAQQTVAAHQSGQHTVLLLTCTTM